MLSRADISSNANNKLNIVIIFKCPYVKWAIWKVQYNSQDCDISYYIIGLFILGIKIRILSVIKPCRKTFYFKFSPFKGKPCTQPFTHIADTCKHSTNTAHGTQLEQIKY